MATGMIENWVNIDVYGPIYPFVGTEGMLVVAGFAFWIIWHIWQLKAESKEFKDEVENIKKRGGVGAVLNSEAKRETSDLTGG